MMSNGQLNDVNEPLQGLHSTSAEKIAEALRWAIEHQGSQYRQVVDSLPSDLETFARVATELHRFEPAPWPVEHFGSPGALFGAMAVQLNSKTELTPEEAKELARWQLRFQARHPHKLGTFFLVKKLGAEARGELVALLTKALQTAHDESITEPRVRASRENVLEARKGKWNPSNIRYVGVIDGYLGVLFPEYSARKDHAEVAQETASAAREWTEEMLWVLLDLIKNPPSGPRQSAKQLKQRADYLMLITELAKLDGPGEGFDTLRKLARDMGVLKGARLKAAKSPLPRALPLDLPDARELCRKLKADELLSAKPCASLEEASRTLGHELPEPLRELYQLHDGCGCIVPAHELANQQQELLHWAKQHLEEGEGEPKVEPSDGVDLRKLLPLEQCVAIGQIGADSLFLPTDWRTAKGAMPVLRLVHDELLCCQPYARSLGELVARQAVEHWAADRDADDRVERLLSVKSFRIKRHR